MAYREYKALNLPQIDQEVLDFWKEADVFERSIRQRVGAGDFVFYEGPPSANGRPGIHHVMSRTVKDLFCRYQTLCGKHVVRKGGWDTHGLPIELSVEKELGITKEDIGHKISIEAYNAKCRETVMRFKNEWDELTRMMGYWVDLEQPYLTFTNDYIESVWYLLAKIYQKGLLYKGYSIQPFSPAAGTGLSSHELNQPGAYREVRDVSAVALFRIPAEGRGEEHRASLGDEEIFLSAWTTTPWTLPSNTALAVGEELRYALVETDNPYTGQRQRIAMAETLLSRWFDAKGEVSGELPEAQEKGTAWKVLKKGIKGSQLVGLRYEPLFDYARPAEGDAYLVVAGDFVSTEEGTGIVHIAPSFGADDMRVARRYGIGTLTLVDRRGRFTPEVRDFSGEYVKEAYLGEEEKAAESRRLGTDRYLSVDERIVIKLKKEGKLLNAQKYAHNYPHCWRTDKPILYYPLDSWFVRVTAVRDRLVALNHTISWKPAATGTGRFGNWLENVQDWNLSRSRYWGIPLPVWRNAGGTIEKCIGSREELEREIELANRLLGLKQSAPQDLHRPWIDEIRLVDEKSGEVLSRETDLIDVWFDSGAMPYAQWHFPFATDNLSGKFPADFIAEGVDQTRGWFYTLHAISTMVFDQVAYRTVVSNGLVLDKNGEKMSKRKGNVVDPFETLKKFGADATRWYLISHADPWENLKFDEEGITEVRNKFFGTLFNTYSFFAIYANIDGFVPGTAALEKSHPEAELDRWILSRLHNLIREYRGFMDDYEPTQAARCIEQFAVDDLSNWYVRLSRRRFWKSESGADKQAAFETLYTCLLSMSQLMASLAPFMAEWLFKNLTDPFSEQPKNNSAHLSDLPVHDPSLVEDVLERRMDLAQRICSMVLALRKSSRIRVRQPLRRVLVPVFSGEAHQDVAAVEELIRAEVNVKQVRCIPADNDIVKKKLRPNFRTLGKKLGKHMKQAADAIAQWDAEAINKLERGTAVEWRIDEQVFAIEPEDVEIVSEDIPGWLVQSDHRLTVALDVELDEALLAEGYARELINRIQHLRKEKDFNVTDRIELVLAPHADLQKAVENHRSMISGEVLAEHIEFREGEYADAIDWLDDERIGLQLARSSGG